MAIVEMNDMKKTFWKGKKVFITGHTGFKGSWLSILLNHLGAEVSGYAHDPPTEPSLYRLCNLDEIVNSKIGDIRDLAILKKSLHTANPEIVIHMAAQSLVRYSYQNPVDTYETNVMGTVNLLEAIRSAQSVKVLVNVTTDKCYENKEWLWGYREDEPLGGFDPYSSSKACSEIVTAAYRRSFFNKENKTNTSIASARAGNVIGGGDWAVDRLIPDFVRAIQKQEKILIRNPLAIRPWQHVLEPLSGYLTLAEKLYTYGDKYSGAWNFGPDDCDLRPVVWIIERLCDYWGSEGLYEITKSPQPHEANYLKLDCSKAKALLDWHPHWNLEKALESIIDFTKTWQENKDLRTVCIRQIEEYLTK